MSEEVLAVPPSSGAESIVKKYSAWSAGLGIIPVPVVDVAAVSIAQLKMLKELAKYYGVEYREHRAKSLIAALVGGVGANGLAYGSVGSMIKAIPGAGTLFGMVAMPACSAALAYAIGKIFTQHFASGGTFLDFDPDKVRSHFAEVYEEGQKVAAAKK